MAKRGQKCHNLPSVKLLPSARTPGRWPAWVRGHLAGLLAWESLAWDSLLASWPGHVTTLACWPPAWGEEGPADRQLDLLSCPAWQVAFFRHSGGEAPHIALTVLVKLQGIAFSSNGPNTQNLWISILDIFYIIWDRIWKFYYFKNYCIDIVDHFVTMQLLDFYI